MSNLMKFLRSISEYWLPLHIGSWMLFVLFLFFDVSDSRPPKEFLITFATREVLVRVFLSASAIGFFTSCILLALHEQKLVNAVVLLLVTFGFVAFILAGVRYPYGSITQHDFEQVNGRGYYLISYPRYEFSQPGCGNCFPIEYGYVLYECGLDGLGCEAIFCQIDFWSNQATDTYITTNNEEVKVYILGELAYTLDPNDSYRLLAGNCYQLPSIRE